jgi:hypothetical protein
VDGNATPMTFDLLDAYLSPDNSQRRVGVGILGHEGSHLLLDMPDQYGCDTASTAALYFDAMYYHSRATHLSPFEKLKSGFVTPALIETNSWATQTLSLGAIETQHEIAIVYDAKRNDREYFILENRWGAGNAYDQSLGSSVVVWHLLEDAALADQFPPPGGATCHTLTKRMRKLVALATPGSSVDLRWADGSSANIRVNAPGPFAEFTDVEVARVP